MTTDCCRANPICACEPSDPITVFSPDLEDWLPAAVDRAHHPYGPLPPSGTIPDCPACRDAGCDINGNWHTGHPHPGHAPCPAISYVEGWQQGYTYYDAAAFRSGWMAARADNGWDANL